MINPMISAAGGENIFDSLHKSWVQVSWEEVIHESLTLLSLLTMAAKAVKRSGVF